MFYKNDLKFNHISHLVEGGLLERLGPSMYHGVQGLQGVEHALDVTLPEVESACFLQPLVPQFVPQDGHSYKLVRHLDLKHVMNILSFYSLMTLRLKNCVSRNSQRCINFS